jgi:hypothetical protein
MNRTLAPDGRRLVTLRGEESEGGGELAFWNVETGEAARRIPMPGGAGREIAIAPDGRRAVIGSGLNARYAIWDVEVGCELGRIEPPRGLNIHGLGLAVAPDGRSVAIGLADGTVLVYPMPEIR